MGMIDDAWRESVRKILDKRAKKQEYIICKHCKGNGYTTVERISAKHIRTKTCPVCQGSGNLGTVADAQKESME